VSAAAAAGRRPEPTPPTRQRLGRVLAFQVLYEVDLTGHPWQAALAEHAEATGATRAVRTLAEAAIAGVLTEQAALDERLARLAPLFPLAQVAPVDRTLLRLALWELRDGSDTPPRVVVNEAVELAKEFGTEASARFVNGVLGTALEEAAPREPQP
jgi:N utilization substance protein B